jgi:hypothetical protein
MVRELREKFLLQFLKVIQLTLLSFPKIPFFHGVHSFLKATSIFPSSSSNGVNQMNLLDELCMACNRPMAMTNPAAATTMQPFAGTNNPSHHHQARPRSASHISSTYHHRDPFANLQYQENYHHHNNQTMARAMSPTTSNGNNMFIPINLLPNQQFAASIPLVLSPTMSHGDQVLEDLPPPTHSYDSADQPRQQQQHQQQQRQDQLLQASFSAPSFEESPGGHSAHKVLRMKSSNLTNNNNNNVAPSAPPPAAVTDSRKINDIFAIKTTLGNPVPRKKTNSLSATTTSTSSNNNNANTNNKTHTTLVTSISLPMINTMNHEEDKDIHGNQEEFDRFPPQTIRPQFDPPPMLMATLPVMTTELLVDSLAHQFPKDVSIHSKHVESEKITNLVENEMNMIHARKLIGKEQN